MPVDPTPPLMDDRGQGTVHRPRPLLAGFLALLALVLGLAWIGVLRLLAWDEFQNPKDGSVLVRVPAGAFLMGSQDGDSDALDEEKPAHEVDLDEYWIGKCEVTNEQFERFVAETGYRTTAEVEGSAVSWRTMKEQWGPQVPVVCVSWFDARAYCEWAGGRLPTEAEWEKAVRGTDGRKYPWGNNWDASLAWCEQTSGGRPHPVGELVAGASPYGCLDMAGNAWEWCSDWSAEYPSSSVRNPTGPGEGAYRVYRGGSWGIAAQYARAASRSDNIPGHRDVYLGFRLASPGAAGQGPAGQSSAITVPPPVPRP